LVPINKKSFTLYEQVVLTEQMPADRVPAFLEENPEFAAWYKERRQRAQRDDSRDAQPAPPRDSS
jgi:hypothetical protein